MATTMSTPTTSQAARPRVTPAATPPRRTGLAAIATDPGPVLVVKGGDQAAFLLFAGSPIPGFGATPDPANRRGAIR